MVPPLVSRAVFPHVDEQVVANGLSTGNISWHIWRGEGEPIQYMALSLSLLIGSITILATTLFQGRAMAPSMLCKPFLPIVRHGTAGFDLFLDCEGIKTLNEDYYERQRLPAYRAVHYCRVEREMQRKTRKIMFSPYEYHKVPYRKVPYGTYHTYRDCTVIVKERAALLTRSPSSAVPMAVSSGLFWIAQSR